MSGDVTTAEFCGFYSVTLCVSAVFAVAGVRPSVRHVRAFYPSK